MGKYDKDRYYKELAIRYCLARGAVPFLEVVVPSVADLSDSVERLTDIDVLGVATFGDGGLRRTIFDCKTGYNMSSVNRAFWAGGLKDYAGCDDAFVILKTKAVHNHRISSLSIDVDLHTEESFKDLGRTIDPAFPADSCYQASVDRWNAVYDCFAANSWSEPLFELSRNAVPLTKSPWSIFRRIIASLQDTRGYFDPKKAQHVAIFFDLLASAFVLWAVLGRDIRRFYEPTMEKAEFEKILRYYLWGGKDLYQIRQQMRQQMREKTGASNGGAGELPAWDLLVSFTGVIVSAPQSLLECAYICREMSIRGITGPDKAHDKAIAERLNSSSRLRQFCAALSEYLIAGGHLPKDMGKNVQGLLFSA
jgi:hypothetical protein